MALDINQTTSNALLQALANAIDAGDPTPGKFQIYTGTNPATPGDAITDFHGNGNCCGAIGRASIGHHDGAPDLKIPAIHRRAWL